MLEALLFQAAIQSLNAQGPQKHRPFPSPPTEPRWPPTSGCAVFPERAGAFQPCETSLLLHIYCTYCSAEQVLNAVILKPLEGLQSDKS